MRRPITMLLGFASFLVGCNSESPATTDTPAPDARADPQAAQIPEAQPPSNPVEAKLPPPGAFVVIAADAPVFTTASETAKQLPRDSTPLDRAAKVVGVSNGFLQVETLPDTLRPCAAAFGFASKARLTLFVRPDALRPVLTTKKMVTYADKTSLELAPGTPVVATPEGTKVVIGPHELSVKIDEAEIGRWFDTVTTLEALRAMPPDDTPAGLIYGLAFRVGEHHLRADPDYFGSGWTSDGLIFNVGNGCGSFQLAVDASPDAQMDWSQTGRGPTPVEADPDPDAARDEYAHYQAIRELVRAGQLSSDDVQPHDCSPTEWLVPAETKLLWPAGDEAGSLLTEHMFTSEPDASAAQPCLELAAGIDVCVARSALVSRTNDLCARQLALVEQRLGGGSAPPQPRVKIGKPKTTGAVDAELIRKIVDIRQNEVRACYTPALAKRPDLAGRVEISFEIGASGRVQSSTVETSEVGEDVGACIAKAVERWKFLGPRDGSNATVVQRFDLSPG